MPRAWKKGPNAVDAHVGSRLRLRRVEQGMTQEKLADAFEGYETAGSLRLGEPSV
jgi:hypothetical protein